MLKNKLKRSEGFTIIEVLIVLAIAGLILLIVFLAVPALQRNARNTTIKNDASALAGGFSEYASNNDGGQPTAISQTGSVVDIGAAAAGITQAQAKVNASTSVTTAKVPAVPGTYTPGTLYWRTGVTCAGATSVRAVIVYYWAETTGTNHTVSCVDAG